MQCIYNIDIFTYWISVLLSGLASKNKEFLAISPGPDHPTAEAPVLLDALIDYFTGTEWKEKTIRDLYEFIQVC